MRFAKWGPVALIVGVLSALGAISSDGAPPHLYLEGSVPTNDTVVTSLPEITLWFSQEPLPNTTQIEVYDVDGKKRMDVSAVQSDPDDPFTYTASVRAPLPPGKYRVAWRTKSDDEDPPPTIWDYIPFTVKAP